MRSLHAALGLGGLLTIVLGTFLPWLRSGDAQRNSYQTGGMLRRLLGLHGPAEVMLSVWPFVALLCAGVVALFAVGLRRVAAATSLIAAAASGAVAVTALQVSGTTFAMPVRLGPLVTLVGAVSLASAATLVLAAPRLIPREQGSNA